MALLAAVVAIGCRAPRFLRRATCGLLALSGLFATTAGFLGLFDEPSGMALPAGLPWLPMQVTLDALGGFFLLVIGLLVFTVSIYSVGYLRQLGTERSLAPLGVFLALFIAGMQGVVLADDAYTFMVFWELMSVASYFLVVFEHEHDTNRRAGFLYLVMAHLGGLLILGAFAVLYSAAGSFEFALMRAAPLDPFWASVAFLLAAFGFGMKAGVVPLHAWLPDAHPAAPSNVSALMSGVMIKVAAFGFLRVVWDLVGLESSAWWWGGLALAAGSASAVGGVLMALQQRDIKRLLAYSSVENIGIVAIGLGLGMIFAHYGHPLLAALALVAALYHVLNHALFKGLLFLGAGAVVHATHSRDIETMGGLIHRLPRTSVLFLVGCLSISALPPFNGFVSEWLTFQAALMAPQLEGTLLSALIPFSAAMLALGGALAAAAFVRLYGIVFLGKPRSPAMAQALEVDRWMQLGMLIPAVFCLVLGMLPTLVIPILDAVPQALLHTGIGTSVGETGWMWLTPIASERASFAAPVAWMALLTIGGISYVLLRRLGGGLRRSAVWSCGHPHLNARMQYTGTSFSQPLRRIFANVYRAQEKLALAQRGNKLFIERVRYAVIVQDLAWRYLYLPIGKATLALAQQTDRIHRRGLHAYLAYTFFTIVALLWLIT